MPRKSSAASTVVVVLLLQTQLGHCRPEDHVSRMIKQEADRRQDVPLNQETRIGDSIVYGLIHDEPPEMQYTAEEKEKFDSKILSVLDGFQQKIVNYFDPGAVVDKATPEDYEPNPIEAHLAIRNGVVQTVDTVAKQINAVLGVPKNLGGMANKKLLKFLNDIGSKLYGLE